MNFFWISIGIAGLCLWVSGESFGVGNRKGGWICLGLAVLNGVMAVLNITPTDQ